MNLDILSLLWYRGLTRGCVTLWPCHLQLKSIFKAKEEELWKLKYFTMQKYNLQNNPLKRNQNP
jgi:hypothetical protein